MNQVILEGRLTKDPEFKLLSGSGTAVANFTLAVDRMKKNNAGERGVDFIPIVAWGNLAENIANFLKKGSQVVVRGEVHNNNYEKQDGTKKYGFEVVIDYAKFIGPTNKGDNSNNISENQQNNEEELTPVDDGDVPF